MKDIPLIAYVICGLDILVALVVIRWYWKNYIVDNLDYYKDDGHDDFS